MAYTKQTWADLPSKTTPINANRLTHIEDGIFNAAQTADTAASTAGTAAANIGIVSGRVETLTDRVNGLDTAVSNKVDKVAGKGLSTNDYDDTDKGKVDSLGTASTKNSTSVVTESSDLVESGAVKDIVGWGNKNLLACTLDDLKTINTQGVWSGNVYTYRGITYTVNIVDGYVTEIVCNGTATNSSSIIKISFSGLDSNTNYVASGSPSGGSYSLYNTYIDGASGADFGDGLQLTGIASGSIVCRVHEPYTAQNLTFKPMIEKGNVKTAYEPYHASVEESKCDNSVIAPVENGTTASQAYAVRSHFIRNGAFCTVTQAISSGGTLKEGTNYTSGDVASEFGLYIPIANNAGFHNSIFRGKNLGSSVTTAQKTAIANGSFEDLYIGDYWEINSIKWRIAHFDYWYRSGDTQCTTHHVVVVPDNVLNNKIMNDKVDNKDVTTGAYINSKMYQSQIADARNIVKTAFGENNILTHREWFANATDVGGWETGGTWYDSQIDLMNEIMVYGSNIFHNCVNGTSWPGGNYTIDKVQLALFRLDQSYTIALNPAGTDRVGWWLRDVCNATNFAGVSASGHATGPGAANGSGVRPAFGIK